MTKHLEHRRQRRFKVKSGAFASFSPQDVRMGQILDISKKGIAFKYVSCETDNKEVGDLSISIPDEGFKIEKIHLKKVIDQDYISDLDNEEERAFEHTIFNRCSVEFGDLNMTQKAMIKYFIKNYTMQEKDTDDDE